MQSDNSDTITRKTMTDFEEGPLMVMNLQIINAIYEWKLFRSIIHQKVVNTKREVRRSKKIQIKFKTKRFRFFSDSLKYSIQFF